MRTCDYYQTTRTLAGEVSRVDHDGTAYLAGCKERLLLDKQWVPLSYVHAFGSRTTREPLPVPARPGP